MRCSMFVTLLGFTLAGCTTQENMRFQGTADKAYLQCVQGAARTLALSSTEAADAVAAAAARSCPGQLKAVEDSRAIPLGAFEASKFAENIEHDVVPQLVAEVAEAQQRH